MEEVEKVKDGDKEKAWEKMEEKGKYRFRVDPESYQGPLSQLAPSPFTSSVLVGYFTPGSGY